jgi:hypothetical protein
MVEQTLSQFWRNQSTFRMLQGFTAIAAAPVTEFLREWPNQQTLSLYLLHWSWTPRDCRLRLWQWQTESQDAHPYPVLWMAIRPRPA